MTTPPMRDQITAMQIRMRRQAEQEPPPQIRGFGAIAYSPSAGAYGWATDKQGRESAEWFATTRCYNAARHIRQYGPVTDVAKVAWGRDIVLALAVNGRGGYGVGFGPTARKAERKARRHCPGTGTVVVCVWSAAPEPVGLDHWFAHGEQPIPRDR